MKYFTRIISVFVCMSFYVYGEQLPMLSEFRSRAVYYVKTKQLDKFSCGYNVLFNAANFENHCGFSNSVYDYSVFQKRVLSHLKNAGYDPKKTSNNLTTEYLARNILHLQPFYHLHMRGSDKAVVPLLTETTRITYQRGTPEYEVKRLLKKATESNQRDVIENIKAILNQKRSAVIHFLCYVISLDGVPHGILISLLQNATGRGLYIFDNLNEPLSRNSMCTNYIEFLCLTFDVSSTKTFTGPQLPALWPYLDTKS